MSKVAAFQVTLGKYIPSLVAAAFLAMAIIAPYLHAAVTMKLNQLGPDGRDLYMEIGQTFLDHRRMGICVTIVIGFLSSIAGEKGKALRGLEITLWLAALFVWVMKH